MKWLLALLLVLVAAPAPAQPATIVVAPRPGALSLIGGGHPLPILADRANGPGVLRAARDLSADFGRVTGNAAPLNGDPAGHAMIILGTIGTDRLIDRLVREGRLDVTDVAGRWEAYVHQIVDHPLPGIDRALVIAGADRRGTIFGVYDLSRAIGVSPWYWWADVPPARHDWLYVTPGRRIDHPAVRYRGIFINDEDPALLGWTRTTFGGFNRNFYEHVFELILRNRGNMLWPAMWGKSFFEDDPENARLANDMGIVIGTSHHEPLMRAHVDWEHHGEGPWDYVRNRERLRAFWREGLARTNGHERLVTVGMRGDGDEPMTQGTAIPLLERIVSDQRTIIADVTGRPAEETPQVWALYKEVQDYYDAGMRVPDDVTLLFSDDNWGNIRRLPEPGAARAGGYGVYYHFDYVGGPRNYKWINTNQIERVWEQMHAAFAYGANRLWIVNVGDIKPMEYPTSFFLDYAWNPDAMSIERLTDYPQRWAQEQFGSEYATEIGALLARYGQLAARRKPELLDAGTYSLTAFDEWDRVMGEWRDLQARAQAVGRQLPPRWRDAYVELVLHPILANANLHALYHAAADGRAEEARRLFARDGEIRRLYEHDIAGGRWAGMMAQTHIGYINWQQPLADVMPAVRAGPAPSATPVHGEIVAIEANHHAAAHGDWRTIPNLGLTGSGMMFWPVTAPPQVPGGNGPRLDYPIRMSVAGEVEVQVTLSPTLDYRGRGGMRYAISIDGEPPQMVNVNGHVSDADWNRAVADNRWVRATRHRIAAPGAHIVHLWAVDPGLVFQRLVVARGAIAPSYLGPPETVAQ